MAGQQGFYNDPVGRRLAYHVDGTKVYAGASLLSEASMRLLNDSNTSVLIIGKNRYVTFIFPEPTTLTHQMFAFSYRSNNSSGSFGSVQVSTDATDGSDGTWTTVSGVSRTTSFTPIVTRNNPIPINYENIIGFRVYLGGHYAYGSDWNSRVHLYGHRVENVHKVMFVDSNEESFAKDFDFGDRPTDIQMTWDEDTTYNQDSPLYIKNVSPEKEAHNIVISAEPTNSTNMSRSVQFSKDFATYTTLLEIDKLMPGEVYGPIYVRRFVYLTDPTSLKSCAAELRVGSWI